MKADIDQSCLRSEGARQQPNSWVNKIDDILEAVGELNRFSAEIAMLEGLHQPYQQKWR